MQQLFCSFRHRRSFSSILPLLALLLTLPPRVGWAQATLSGTSYTQSFDAITTTAPPPGWTVQTGATATALGTSQTLATTKVSWANTTGNFRNVASADGLTATATTVAQDASTDRAIGLRQSGTFGDPGAAFVLQLANTTGFTGFTGSFKLQNVDPQTRITDFRIDYGTGATPSSFTAIGSTFTQQTFGSNTVTPNFGTALDNLAGPVWIRIVALVASTGTGSRDTYALDDFTLSYSASASPSVVVSTANLAVGTTVVGSASTPAATYNVSGTNLGTTAITVTAPSTEYQVSLSSGSGFAAFVTTAAPVSGTITATPIYVRLTGNTVGSPTGNVTNVSGTGSANVAVTGTVTGAPVPTVNVSTANLAVGTTVVGSPSTPAATYNVSGTNLGTTAITVAAPNADFQVSLASGSGFGSSVTTAAPVSGTVASTPIYVRLAGTTIGAFSGNATNVSGTASANVALSGTVTATAASAATLVNYDFNSGTSYATLAPVTATNVSVTASSTEAFATFGGVATTAAAFATNPTAGNAVAMNNSSGTSTKYFQFALGGADLSTYGSYKVYVQAQRSNAGAQLVTLAYSTNGSTFTNAVTTLVPGNGSFVAQVFDLTAITALNLQSSVTFRLLASGASGSGTLRIDNFQVQAVGGGAVGAGITVGTVSPSPVCAGSNVTVNYTTSGTFSGGNVFAAQLSDATGSFASGTTPLATVSSTATSITATIPATIAGSSLYQIRVNGSAPATAGSPAAALTVHNVLIAPTAAQNIAASVDGTLLTADEQDLTLFGSRQWFSGTSAAGPYTTALTGVITDVNQNEYTPNFATAGTYYVVVKTTFTSPACTLTSNAVPVNVGLAGISITTDSVSVTPICVGPTGAPISVAFSTTGAVSGFTAYISSNGFVTKTAIGSGATSPISAVIPNTTGAVPTLAAGSTYRIRVEATTPATIGTDTGDNLTLVPYQTNEVTSLTATPANGQIALSWINPAACVGEVLVIARQSTSVTAVPNGTATYTANPAFGTGSAVAAGQFAMYQGTGTGVTVTGLTNGLNYTFKVFVKNITGNTGRYNVGSAVTAVPAVPAVPVTVTEIYVPLVVAGHPVGTTTNTARLPYAFRLTLAGLTPGATYRYTNQALLTTDAVTTGNAVGNAIYANSATGATFVRSAAPSMVSAGNFGTLTADAAGTYTGWFILEPTGSAKFETGQELKLVIFLNNGSGGTTVARTATTTSTVTALRLGGSVADASAVYGASFATAANFVLGYATTTGTGRPLFGTVVESDGAANTAANGYATFYGASVEGQVGQWGALLANSTTAGLRRVEQRDRVGGALVGCAATDADGTWGSGVATAAPRAGDVPLVLTRLDAPLTCPVLAGINPGDRTQVEGSISNVVTLKVTVPNPPTATLTVTVTDAGTGTATAGTDYTFTTQNLTFLTTDTYPLTKNVTVTFLGDAVGEADETIVLNVTTSGAPATVVSSPTTVTLADDDFIQPGLILNEFSNGASGSKEYVELLVTGTPGKTVNLQGWVFDDNNGDFSNGNVFKTGITTGHIRFNTSCTWEKVLVGSLIVFYNAADPNPKFSGTAAPGTGQIQDDPTDANLDYVYVVPVQGDGTCGNTTGGAADYFFGSCNAPHSATSSAGTGGVTTYEDATVGPLWTNVSYKNEGDAVQIRQPAASGLQPAFFQGISYGSSSVATDPADNLTQVNHPNFGTLGTEALYFAVTGAGRAFYFDNTLSNDFRRKGNWVTTTALATYESPGRANSARNTTFINNLRQRAGIVTTAKTYACNVRPLEARTFLDSPSDDIILRLDNNSPTNLGVVTAATSISGSGGVRNPNLPGKPFFLSKQFVITPTNTVGPTNYQVTFFVTDAELDAYALYLQTQIGGSRTANFLRPRLKIWKVAGSTPPATLPGVPGGGIDTATATLVITADNYGVGVTTYTATFTSFSAFSIGASTSEAGVLPVELTRFAAVPASARTVAVTWATASEKNADRFEVERSADGRRWQVIGSVAAHGTTAVPQYYGLVDAKALPGQSYYRLRQVDTDGAARLSGVVPVQLGAPGQALLAAWPVPFGAELHLTLTSAAAGSATVRLYDLRGRAVLHQVVTLTAGATDLTLPTATLGAGIYVAETVLPTGEVLRRKVVK